MELYFNRNKKYNSDPSALQANQPPTTVQHRRIKAGQMGSQERVTLIKKQIQLILGFLFFFSILRPGPPSSFLVLHTVQRD